jgi:FKBP-type peptidyl-prolyl cis-trans isomerase
MTLPALRRGRTLLLVNTTAAAALFAGAMLAQAQEPGATPAPATSPAAAGPNAAKKPGAKAGAAKEEPSQKSSTSYSLGVIMGEQLRGSGVAADAVSSQRIAQGVHDALTGKAKAGETDRQNMVNLLRHAQETLAETNHRAAAKFLAENAKKPDVVTTESGLQYKVLTPGSGAPPGATDEATLKYRGTLLDGTEFDSSRGESATFQVNHVIPGFTEALRLMKPGAKYQVFIPPQLAYDLRSRPPIPPGSLLIFEIELLSSKPAPAPAAAAKPGQPEPGAAVPATPPPAQPKNP